MAEAVLFLREIERVTPPCGVFRAMGNMSGSREKTAAESNRLAPGHTGVRFTRKKTPKERLGAG